MNEEARKQFEAILAKSATARDKLATNHPDLADKVNVAISQARDSFDDGDGKPATDTCEFTSLADALDAIAKAPDADAVNDIVTGNLDGLSDTDRDALLAAGNARIGEMEA